jgi:hypothetical protein
LSEEVVRTQASADAVRAALSSLPDAIRASGSEVMLRVADAILGRIREAFLVKSRGGTDEAGDSWVALQPRTIAYRRGNRNRRERKRDAHPSQALTKRQQERWRAVYSKKLRQYRDKSRAAAIAWLVLKSEGATTLFDKYANRQVEILRDTDDLLKSLSPGEGTTHSIRRVGPGEVIVGTSREGAAAHHDGAPSRNLPQRRLWPEPGRWPVSWWRAIAAEVVAGLLDAAKALVQGATGG